MRDALLLEHKSGKVGSGETHHELEGVDLRRFVHDQTLDWHKMVYTSIHKRRVRKHRHGAQYDRRTSQESFSHNLVSEDLVRTDEVRFDRLVKMLVPDHQSGKFNATSMPCKSRTNTDHST